MEDNVTNIVKGFNISIKDMSLGIPVKIDGDIYDDGSIIVNGNTAILETEQKGVLNKETIKKAALYSSSSPQNLATFEGVNEGDKEKIIAQYLQMGKCLAFKDDEPKESLASKALYEMRKALEIDNPKKTAQDALKLAIAKLGQDQKQQELFFKNVIQYNEIYKKEF
ncbi:MAG: hypothetical protein ACD_82C00123G0001, partial [uncultured bacterium]